MTEPPQAEGWYQDPFGAHEARWFSDGRPSALVRDAGVESHDQPPDGFVGGVTLAEIAETARPGDLARADAAEEEYAGAPDLQRAGGTGTVTPGQAAMEAEPAAGPTD